MEAEDALQRYVAADRRPGARLFVAPSREAAFLVRRFPGVVAPEAETWVSRLVATVVVAPFTQFTLLSFDLQAFLYEIFHQRRPARVAHFVLMPAVNFFVLAALVRFRWGTANLSIVYAVLLTVWYAAMAAQARMPAWGVVTAPIVGALCIGAHVFDARFSPSPVVPLILALSCAAGIAISHGGEDRLPPRVTREAGWLSIAEFLGGPGRLRRFALFAVQPISGTVNEFFASARLMPYGVLMRMFRLGYRPEVSARLADHVRRATESGDPALDYVGIGGATRLDPAAFRRS